jgi:hypothetical protein
MYQKSHQDGFIKNIIAIGTVLAVVFLSQTNHAKVLGEKLKKYPPINVVGEWTQSKFQNTIETVGGEVGQKKDLIEAEIINQKESLEEKSTTSLKKFLAEKTLQALSIKPEDLVDKNALMCPK